MPVHAHPIRNYWLGDLEHAVPFCSWTSSHQWIPKHPVATCVHAFLDKDRSKVVLGTSTPHLHVLQMGPKAPRDGFVDR